MDALELLGGDAPFVPDTSAWWRFSRLTSTLGALVQQAIIDDRVLITPVVRMEILYSARSTAQYAEHDARLGPLRMLRNDRAVADAAMRALTDLSTRGDGYHRVSVSDALIAAAAAEHGFAVLQRDAHFDRLAEVLAFDSVTIPVA